MIHVEQAPEPGDFTKKVRSKGQAALLELIGSPDAPRRRGRPRNRGENPVTRVEDLSSDLLPDIWTEALPDLRKAYRDICAYLGMYIDRATGLATVDHFVPKSKNQALAYEWTNFRLAAHQVNANKGDHEDVLDPFEIKNGVFVLDLGTFKIEPADGLSEEVRKAVIATRERLKLNDPTFCAARARYHDLYHGLKTEPDDPDEPLPYAWLVRNCPFVAYELRRQGRLRGADGASDGTGGEGSGDPQKKNCRSA
jgi:5-methylcytosine-specific restriction endonuclease McrA